MSGPPRLKEELRRVPLLGAALTGAARIVRRRTFPGSQRYWERHYARGGNSGEGSSGRLALAKAQILNDFVADNRVESVLEFGCGDGQQLALAKYPRYLGLDVSVTTLRATAARNAGDATKSFLRYDPDCFSDPAGWLTADLVLSLDVIYHLVEDRIYRLHLRHVFASSTRYVVLFTSDADRPIRTEHPTPHVRHRPVVRDVADAFPAWRLRERIPNPHPYQGVGTDTSFADVYIYQRTR